VDRRADRDVRQRKGVSRLDVRVRPGEEGVPLLEALRTEDVALLAVPIVEERDARERFGSYSMCATLAGTPGLFRLKSIIR